MAISTISITQGTGTNITVDTSGSGDMQVIKLAESSLGSAALVPASATTGLLVNLGSTSGTAASAGIPVTNVSGQNLNVAVVGSVTVAGSVSISGTPAVSQSGTWNIGTVTTITNTVTVAGSVSISGTPAVSQSGTWNIGTVTTITNPVTVTGSVSVSGTATVSGTVTSNQGSAAAIGSAWPVKLTDGTNSITMVSVSGTQAVPVKVLAQAGGGFSQQDKTAFTEGTTFVEVVGGVYNDAFAGAPAAGQASVARITANRAFHVNLRSSGGSEAAVTGNPLIVQPAATDAQGLAVTGVRWRQHVALSASQTAQAIRTPTSGKTTYVKWIQITLSVGGSVIVYDNSDSSTTELFNGTLPVGNSMMRFDGEPLSAVNNVLRYSTGTGVVGDLVAGGWEA